MTEPLVSFDNSSASAPHRGDSVGSCKVGADCNPYAKCGRGARIDLALRVVAISGTMAVHCMRHLDTSRARYKWHSRSVD